MLIKKNIALTTNFQVLSIILQIHNNLANLANLYIYQTRKYCEDGSPMLSSEKGYDNKKTEKGGIFSFNIHNLKR